MTSFSGDSPEARDFAVSVRESGLYGMLHFIVVCRCKHADKTERIQQLATNIRV